VTKQIIGILGRHEFRGLEVDRYANRVLRKCYSNAKTRFQSFFMLIPPSLTQGRGNAAGVLSTVANTTTVATQVTSGATHLRIANFWALSSMRPEPTPTAPFVLRAMHCHAKAGVENAATTIKPPAAAANKSLIIPTQIP
jgi:hypothetical protein